MREFNNLNLWGYMVFYPFQPIGLDSTNPSTRSPEKTLAENSMWAGRKIKNLTHSMQIKTNMQEVFNQSHTLKSENRIDEQIHTQTDVAQSPSAQPVQNRANILFRFRHALYETTIPQSKGPRGMRYEPINTPELREKIVKENFRYAGYMYGGSKNNIKGTENGVQVTFDSKTNSILMWNAISLSPSENKILLEVNKKLTEELGFKIDERGNFYHFETGTIFNLVYDHKQKEVIICFMGLGNGIHVDTTKEEQNNLNAKALKTVVQNTLGGVPLAITQAIQLGKLLKEITHETGFTPVMVGHSHGGSLAQAAAIGNGLKGIIFNPEPIGTGIKAIIDKLIGKENRKIFAKQVIAFSVKGDWLTDGSIHALSRFGRDYGLPVSTVMGKGYQLPKAGDTLDQNHCNFYQSFTLLANEQQ